jgi:nitrous oxide reductase accessory protein NosL
VISLADGSKHAVQVKGWSDLNYITWSADGKGWYVMDASGQLKGAAGGVGASSARPMSDHKATRPMALATIAPGLPDPR